MKKQSKFKKPESRQGVAAIPKHQLQHAIVEQIRQRANEIHQARGGAPGQELDDWLQAEREITVENAQASEAQA